MGNKKWNNTDVLLDRVDKQAQLLRKIIRIDSFHFVYTHRIQTEIRFEHEFGEGFSVYQYYLVLDSCYIISGLFRKRRCCNEYSLPCPLLLQGSYEFLDFGPSHLGTVPFFRLDVDDVEAEPVFLYYAIYSMIARFTDRLSCILNRTAVTHFNEKIDDELFEKCRRELFDLNQ
jgi:hypothetical protein